MTKQIEVLPATADLQPVLANLLELYIHDFSEFRAFPIGEDGRFRYPRLELYWQEEGRHPFLVKVAGELAGLALVRLVEGATWDMAEFFILRGHRKRGIGVAAAHEIWRRFPGTWRVRVLMANQQGVPFWRRAVSEFVGKAVAGIERELNGRPWLVFEFSSPGLDTSA